MKGKFEDSDQEEDDENAQAMRIESSSEDSD